MHKLILLILILGIVYRLVLTSGGNFIFNMDNARDMVDTREMVVQRHLRLIGPTSAIEGFYNGPGWYYLLAVPFILSGGHPYAAIIMEIILWVIGGYFLLKLAEGWGVLTQLFVGVVWISSNFILLMSAYAFNPNSVTLLAPLFIYLLLKFIETKKIFYSILTWTLAGLFFNFEMNAGVFIPLVILLAVILSKNTKLFKGKVFWIGVVFYLLTLLPQVLFDLKHQFIMTHSIINYLSSASGHGQATKPFERLPMMINAYYSVLLPTFENFKQFVNFYLILLIGLAIGAASKMVDANLREGGKRLILILVLIILVPFVGFIFIPVGVNSWHLGLPVVAAILLGGYILNWLGNLGFLGKVFSWLALLSFIFFSLTNVKSYLIEAKKQSLDPAVFRNELSAIDYVYSQANGKNFKVYTYLPSVIDYPYQYLFWWRGISKYGYTPEDYAYLPNKPPYISGKELLNKGNQPPSSGLIFLIKQPDEIRQRHLWENSFKHLELISSEKVGPLIVEIRKEATLK